MQTVAYMVGTGYICVYQKRKVMKTGLEIGQKFKSGYKTKSGKIEFLDTVYTIYNITDKRVCYTDGKSSYCGSTNVNKSGFWLGLERFKKDILSGRIELL